MSAGEGNDAPFPVYDTLSFEDYLNHHLLPNTPFLLSAKATAHWPARQNWCLLSSGPSRPNLAALRAYAHHIVPVANTLTREFSEFERDERPLGEVLDAWESGEGEGLYVKDWHLFAEIEKDGGSAREVYDVPECLRDDWLNPPFGVARAATDVGDFRFAYVGPVGTFTPLHRDVYASYSWSANVVGRKMWWLFPPDRLERVKRDGEFAFDVREIEEEGGGIKVVQQEGEVVFVPSGWYHQVVNLDFCISINHNFFSSPTLPRIFTAMEEAQVRVELAINDVKDMIRQRLGKEVEDGLPLWELEWMGEVQALLERDSGWGWRGFWETIRTNVLAPVSPLCPPAMRHRFVREVIDQYKRRREWVVLADIRDTVLAVEAAL